MNQIVKAETAPTMSQATTSASVFIALPRDPLDRSHPRLSLCGARESRAPHPRQRDTAEVSRFFFWLKDITCWLRGGFSACWCGKINIEYGCFIVGV